MRLSEIDFQDQLPIDSYGPGFFRVQNQIHEGPLLILPNGVVEWAGHKDIKPLLSVELDVLFLGTGSEIAPLPKTLQSKLEKAGVPFELMSTPSAARTYNVLLSEGRRVGAALMPIT